MVIKLLILSVIHVFCNITLCCLVSLFLYHKERRTFLFRCKATQKGCLALNQKQRRIAELNPYSL